MTDSIGVCDDCATAAKQSRHAGLRSDCKGCAARAVVRSPIYRQAFATGYGWFDIKLQRLCDIYSVSREALEAAAEIEADVKEGVK